ncbi:MULTISPECIES: Ger(x)C family spore germination protein [Desulfitobacterium]|uniref:Germination protein, Ger(X)C family n=1 Tax=Desulfitobacterium dehalogenans (strain ATCC 51507 / DSM 9161 / JW/IU-DC1) TaxID=756499 RepID=I4AAS5_DESDJ|nr:Ger(x)C family spore germination protein [Desulfitobacterium sp. PCE1]AFM01060.1 germination protein, Ger(X)C family [Desulfitobacterium dehalogenans ATCC 51507]
MIIRYMKRWVILIALFLLLLLPGCWSHQELNEIGVVSAMGLDLSEQGKLRLTVEVINPQAYTTKGQQSKTSTRILTSEGETLFEVARDLMTKSGDRLFYPHNQVIVIGEDLARAGLLPALDFLERDPEIRLFTWIMLTEGKAEEIIRAPSKESLVSAMHLKLLVEDYKSTSKGIPKNILDFTNMIYTEGIEPTLGKIKFYEEKGEPTFHMIGGGAFKEDKLIAWLDAEEARGYLWVHNDIKGGIITAHTMEGVKKTNRAEGSSGLEGRLSFEIIRAKSRVKPVLEGEKLRFVIDINVTCNLGERTDNNEAVTKENFKELEAILSQAVIGEVQVVLEKAQKELNSDILGFGLATQRKYPDYWNQHKDNWEKIFPDLDVEILVKAVVDDPGSVR